MIFHKLRVINKNQLGFTLVELMLAMAISGVIIGGISTTIYQVVIGNLRTGNHMTAVRQVQEAGYWVSHDAHMTQNVELADVSVDDPDGTRFPFTLTWVDWGSNKAHQVVYTLVDMPSGGLKNLQRSHSINGDTNTDIIAQFIDPDPGKTNCYLYKCLICDEVFASLAELEAHFAIVHPLEELEGNYESDKLTFTVTATVGTGSQEQSETRVYEAKPRPGSW